jgi:hypothetical protein
MLPVLDLDPSAGTGRRNRSYRDVSTPCPPAPSGEEAIPLAVGYYTLDGSLLTMTDGKGGTPFRGESGERIKHKLQTGEDLDAIAKRLTMKICRTIRGRVGGL